MSGACTPSSAERSQEQKNFDLIDEFDSEKKSELDLNGGNACPTNEK